MGVYSVVQSLLFLSSLQIWAGAADANPEYINLFTAGILTAGLMLLTGCFNGKQARDSIDWRVYVTIAFAFAFSTAMETSNVAQAIADVFTDISECICTFSFSAFAVGVLKGPQTHLECVL
jgi:di/tricarboxylate transporter